MVVVVVVLLFTCALFVLFVGQFKLFYEGDIVVLSFDARRVGVDDLASVAKQFSTKRFV